MASQTATDGLIPLGRKLPLRVYLRQLWDRREFAVTVPLGELRAMHMDSLLGNVWHLLNPLLSVAVYYLVFGVVLSTSRGVENFITYLAIGVFVYSFSQRGIIAASGTIPANVGLIRSLSFPRALLPLSAVIRETLAHAPAVALMVLLALVTGERPSVFWLAVVPITLLQALFTLGVGFVFARLTDRFRDTTQVLPYLFRLAFYMSGVLYSVSTYVSRDLFQAIFAFNPFFAFITATRVALMSTYPTEAGAYLDWYVVSMVFWAVVAPVLGFWFFRAAETEYGRG